MVKNSIKIYARLKQENPAKSTTYEVLRTEKHETITFRLSSVGDFLNNKPQSHRFRFEKVFDQYSTQSQVFDTIAKPIVNSVLQGFNGTIFAYGQTGSGKTYAITGSSQEYQERGIIPRSIEEIFESINRTPEKYTIYISYLEIYNEIGYDLLNPKLQISSLEELPFMDVANYRLINKNYYQTLHTEARKVVLLEDGKGESHLRNLSLQKVSSEQEAMRLLFLGDTNRTIAETPMNVYSSRSHCIFTICVTSRNTISGKIRRSKLNLVDLAGSERINKSNISGITLNEAKYINLSLHYLEQVVLALSQKRAHIPFRNSMLTYMLRDSLSGNCMTVLLATLAVNKRNIEETVATCKFAQRVAEVNMEAVMNAEVDPQQEIEYLKSEIESLRKQLMQQSRFKISGKLTKEEKENWKRVIHNYLSDSKNELPLTNFDMRHIQYCFKLLKEAVNEQKEQKLMLKSAEENNNELVQKYKEIIEQKEEEISTLKCLLYSDTKSPAKNLNLNSLQATKLNSPLEIGKENIPPDLDSLSLSPAQKVAFEIFMQDPKNRSELDYYKQSVEETYEIAKKLTSVVEQCQNNILTMRAKHRPCVNRVISAEMDLEMLNQQSIYRNSLAKLEELRKETDHFKQGMENAKMDVLKNFRDWYDSIGCGSYKTEIKNFHEFSKDDFWDKILSPTVSPKSSPRNISENNKKTEYENLWRQSGDNTVREKGGNSNNYKDHSRNQTRNYNFGDLWKEGGDNSRVESENDCGNSDNPKDQNKNRSKSPARPPRYKLEELWKPGGDSASLKSKKKGFQEEDNENANDYKDQEWGKFKDTFKESTVKSQNRYFGEEEPRSENNDHDQDCTTSKISSGIANCGIEELWKPLRLESRITNYLRDKENGDDKSRSRSMSNSPQRPGNNSDNLCKRGSDHSVNKSRTSRWCREGRYSNAEKCENQNRNRSRSPRKSTKCNCDVLWKHEDDCYNKKEEEQERSKSRSHQTTRNDKCDASFCYDSKSKKTALSSNRRFSFVYQDIMGYNDSFSHNVEQLTSERPYSSEVRKKSPITNSKLSTKPKIRETQAPTNQYWNTHYVNYSQRVPAKAQKGTVACKTHHRDFEEEEEGEGAEDVPSQCEVGSEEKFVLTERKPGNVYHQNDLSFKAALNQKQLGYRVPSPLNKDYVSRFENIPHVSDKEDGQLNKRTLQSASPKSDHDINLFSPEDSQEFRDFIKTIPLTGDAEVDEEIIKFYRTKYVYTKNT